MDRRGRLYGVVVHLGRRLPGGPGRYVTSRGACAAWCARPTGQLHDFELGWSEATTSGCDYLASRFVRQVFENEAGCCQSSQSPLVKRASPARQQPEVTPRVCATRRVVGQPDEPCCQNVTKCYKIYGSCGKMCALKQNIAKCVGSVALWEKHEPNVGPDPQPGGQVTSQTVVCQAAKQIWAGAARWRRSP